MSSARDSPAAAAFASRAAASARLMAKVILMRRGSPGAAGRRPAVCGLLCPFAFLLPLGAPAPGRAPPRPDFFGAGFFSVVLARDIFRGRFYFWNWRLPAMGLKPLFFRYRVIMVMLAECQRFLARADFPPLIGLRGAFAAARGGFWRPDLKCEKMRLLKINNLRRKLSDYYSLHARPRARGGEGGASKSPVPPLSIYWSVKKFFCLKMASQNTHQNDKSL